ncbi:hypothetical protein SAMN05428996_2036 [Quadrisphaera sp. DSM 44207]|nr:hypothetical protein SAMN05428996_2036 [Quadrisphaera sp. DSM 44207]
MGRGRGQLPRLIPAYAGSTWRAWAWPIRALGSSPRTRGAHPRGRLPSPLHGLIPAYAGSTPWSTPRSAPCGAHPRVRGEHVVYVHADDLATGSSPRTQGARRPRQRAVGGGGLIPAYAGSTDGWRRTGPWSRAHPRVRGEHSRVVPGEARVTGSSPRTRGALPEVAHLDPGGGLIPAYAGSTRSSSPAARSGRAHPRVRGEHGRSTRSSAWARGSSPRTRAALPEVAHLDSGGGLIPAYAGSTTCRPPDGCVTPAHPRVRGEHPPPSQMCAFRGGSSPRTRGALPGRHPAEGPRRLIPAYAGSTRCTSSSPTAPRAHPRVRGEHLGLEGAGVRVAGSSPRTRGAPLAVDQRPRPGRLIPAYAGSTTIDE